MTPSLLFIVGPTASGKTALSLALSTRLSGEIVSMDSMQIYRTLDIGTGKPSRDELNAVRHHVVDIRNPDEAYSAAQWAHDANAAIEDIVARAKTPIIVGGTGFYARSLLFPETLASAPPDAKLRAELEVQLQQHGVDWLHDQLRILDAGAAQRLNVNDTRRVIRAIEVAIASQKSEAGSHRLEQIQSSKLNIENSLIFGLEWPREVLYRRIEMRIEQMLRDGFMDELRRLVSLNLDKNSATAIHSLGYKQMSPVLEDATRFDECLELWKRDTRRYAKRQMTWFRHQLPTRWLTMNEETSIETLADEMAQQYVKHL
jgi:tRNA dimethylallyltransferase